MSIQDRRTRDREQRRSSILEAAERVFFDKGLNATMDDIASEARLAKGTLYLYFASKEDLYLTLICKGLDLLIENFRAVQDENLSPEEKIHRLGEIYLGYYKEHPNYFSMLNDSTYPTVQSEVSPQVLELVFRKSSTLWSMFAEIFQEGIDKKVFRDDLSAYEMSVLHWTSATGHIRLIDAMKKATIWERKKEGFTLKDIDLYRIYGISRTLLLDAMKRKNDESEE